VSDRLGAVCHRQEPLGAGELDQLQSQLIDVDMTLRVVTVGEIGVPVDDCEVYSDGSPVYSLVRAAGVVDDVPGEFLTGDIWDVPAGVEPVVHEPPHRR
jgi:hypothetical protein